MEQNAIQWLGPPCCLRGSFAFYKSVCYKPEDGGPIKVWRLGEFYFVRSGPEEPVCIAEVTLLWQDQRQRYPLASLRFYYLPEDTPKGRTQEHGEAYTTIKVNPIRSVVSNFGCPAGQSLTTEFHGGVFERGKHFCSLKANTERPRRSCVLHALQALNQNTTKDEVIAVSKKVVVRVENLVKWTCSEPPQWKGSCLKRNGHHIPDRSHITNPEDVKTKDDSSAVSKKVKVLSYLQYCRFRSLQKRLQHQSSCSIPPDSHLLALGWIRVALHNTQILYCRDTFSHPSLDNNPSLTSEYGCLSVSLKGRPRKRKGRDCDGTEHHFLNQAESWGERIKEKVMGSVALMFDGSWLPHPEERIFLDQLYLFMERRGSPIGKVPNLGFKKIDLFLLYSVVNKLGGYDVVTSQRLWKLVYDELGGSPGSTSAATCTRRHYERLVLPYEQHIKGASHGLSKDKSPSTEALVASIRKPGRGRGTQIDPRKNGTMTQASPPDGMVIRKRGRPPGKRNAKILPRGRVGRPPSHTKTYNEQVMVQGAQPPITKELTYSQAPMANTHSCHQSSVEAVNMEHKPSTPSLFSGQAKLQIGGALEGFSISKGMYPMDFLRARLGFSSVSSPERTADASIISKTKASSPDTPEVLQHQCSGCSSEHPSWAGGPREGLTAKPPLPPLKILPLDIDCSLQLHQLMHTRLGTAHMNTFTKRLSEALAQDLGKGHQINGHTMLVSQEQAAPLNLSKKATNKRSSDDRDSEAKRLKMEPVDLRLFLKPNESSSALSVVQDEPADLSCPGRVRAFSDRTGSVLAGFEEPHLISKSNVSSVSIFPFNSDLNQHEDESVPVDLKRRESGVWKPEPERTLAVPNIDSCLSGEHLPHPIPYEECGRKDYKVSSIKELSKSHFTKPSQSC